MAKNASNQISFLQKYLTGEVKFVGAIVGLILGVVGPYYGIMQHLALIDQNIRNINENHIAHMQDLAQQVKEEQGAISALQAQLFSEDVKIEKQQELILKLIGK